MRCSNCGEEIQSGRESGMKYGERQGATRTIRRVLLGVFSSGWVVTAAISEFWHAKYIAEIHKVDFAQQTPSFFQTLDIDIRSQSEIYFMGSCLWLTLVLFVWAWKLATHIERSNVLAQALRSRPPASDA